MTVADLTTQDEIYEQALGAMCKTLGEFQGCTEAEKEALQRDWAELREMLNKLRNGRIDIAVFGEINTGKSALINALVGQSVTESDVRGGWTKENWTCEWAKCGYSVPGLDHSKVVIVDTPGINEVEGEKRAAMARDAAQRADLILFITDSDLNQIEFAALGELAKTNRPLIVVLNKMDLYNQAQRARLLEVLRNERLAGVVVPDHIVPAAADPLEKEYVIEAANGSTRTETRKPPPQIDELKTRILEILAKDGKALLAINAALYTADKSDKITAKKMELRDVAASRAIWSCVVSKAVAVAINPVPFVDVAGGAAVDVAMVAALANIYGFTLTKEKAGSLALSIISAASGVLAVEWITHAAAHVFKGLTFGVGTLITALPQGAAAGFGSYVVGQAAKYYFEHGASWGTGGPKAAVQTILATVDKDSVLQKLKAEISQRIHLNRAAGGKTGRSIKDFFKNLNPWKAP